MKALNLDRVTITGADDSVAPAELLALSRDFPFVEWGILVSNSHSYREGTPRFPSVRWITDLQGIAETTGELKLSLHVCGLWVRDLLIGRFTIPPEFLSMFQRVQLNFHAERTRCDAVQFAACLDKMKGKDFIFQFDGATGNQHMDAACSEGVENCYALFDVSGGAGVVPAEWPKPYYIDVQPGEHGEGAEQWAYHGYAGGLGPHNLVFELERIEAAADGARIWIDMETHVRDPDDRILDMQRVRHALSICDPIVHN